VQALHRSQRWRTVSLWQWRREGGAYKHRVRHIIKPHETTAKKKLLQWPPARKQFIKGVRRCSEVWAIVWCERGRRDKPGIAARTIQWSYLFIVIFFPQTLLKHITVLIFAKRQNRAAF